MGDGNLSVDTENRERTRPVRGEASEADQAQYQLCFACGPGNAGGLRLEFRVIEDSGDDHVFAEWTPNPAVHQGWPHTVHGGLVAALLDEGAAYVAYVRDQRAATARLNIRFHGPALIDDPLRIDARLTRATRRLMEVHAWVSVLSTGSTIAEADVSLMLMTEDQRTEFGLSAGPTD